MIYDWQSGPHNYFGSSLQWGFYDDSPTVSSGTSAFVLLLGAG